MKHFKIKVLFFMSGRIPDRLLISAKYVRVLRGDSGSPLLHPLQSLPYTNKKSICVTMCKGHAGILSPTTALARLFTWWVESHLSFLLFQHHASWPFPGHCYRGL